MSDIFTPVKDYILQISKSIINSVVVLKSGLGLKTGLERVEVMVLVLVSDSGVKGLGLGLRLGH